MPPDDFCSGQCPGGHAYRNPSLIPHNLREFGDETVLALALLKYAAEGPGSSPGSGPISLLERAGGREVQWILDAGLGPMLHRACRERGDPIPERWRDLLRSAELTARVRHGGIIDAACEVIDLCRERSVPVTLLKGISVSDQYYPEPYLRPMADIDLLVPAEGQEPVESALLARGYLPLPDHGREENPRHGVPLCHPGLRVWFEVHTALFDDAAPGDTFSSGHVAAETFPATFHGRTVGRLSDELQLLYLATSWIADLSRYGVKIHPSCLPALFDAVYLLKCRTKPLCQDALVGPGDGEMAVASLHVMLALLARCGLDLCDTALVSRLGSSQTLVGPVQLRIFHAVLERYLLGGRPWNLPFPLPVPGRYSIRHQLRKRLTAGRPGAGR